MRLLSLLICLVVFLPSALFGRSSDESLFLVMAKAKNQKERNRITSFGIAIDRVLSDSVAFIASQKEISRLKKAGLTLEVSALPEPSRDFPSIDAAFHNYNELKTSLEEMAATNSDIVQLITIGKSWEGRELYGVRLSAHPEKDSLPTTIFMGCHHAREHLSVEVPLMLAKHLVQNYGRDERITRLLETREVWIVPMVNPDGAEFDISARHQHGSSRGYKYWRKNRRNNQDGTFGVDLNRNYGGPNWGGEGSSSSTSSDVYRGPSAFSEPETMAVRDFIRSRKKATTLLTYHTFSELIIWPWGYTDNAVENTLDRQVFETMGKTMANWNKYTPKKASALYITSGDTTDWAYDELKLFAFTFELSPTSLFEGGFYPGAKAIDPTFKANLEPALYLIENSDDPYKVARLSADPLAMR